MLKNLRKLAGNAAKSVSKEAGDAAKGLLTTAATTMKKENIEKGARRVLGDKAVDTATKAYETADKTCDGRITPALENTRDAVLAVGVAGKPVMVATALGAALYGAATKRNAVDDISSLFGKEADKKAEGDTPKPEAEIEKKAAAAAPKTKPRAKKTAPKRAPKK